MDNQVVASMSEARFSTYLRAAAFDADRARRLYIWNAEIGAAFYLPIQSVEVVLRNQIVTLAREYFGPQWWGTGDFQKLLNEGSLTALKRAKRDIRRAGHDLNEGQIVSTLSFGFWTSLANPDNGFVPLDEWMPHHPSHEVLFVRRSLLRVSKLRNRISHHEPIFKMDLLREYSFIMELLHWLCPATHDWIRPHCRVAALVRQKP